MWRAVCDKKYVDVSQIKNENCSAFLFRLYKIIAFSLFPIVEIIVPFMSAVSAATVCSVILFAHKFNNLFKFSQNRISKSIFFLSLIDAKE